MHNSSLMTARIVRAAILGAFALGVGICGCSGILSSTAYRVNVDDGVHKPSEFPVLRATGYAVLSRQPGPTRTERQLQAMRSSKIDAYRELTEQVYGTYVQADTSLRDTVQRQNKASASVEGLIHGARVIRQYPLGDTYVTEVELDTKALYDMYEIRGTI